MVGPYRLVVLLVTSAVLGLGPAGSAHARHAGQTVDAPRSGLVVDVSGAPVPGAAVRLSRDGADIGETESGADGRFALPDVAPGELVITVTSPGFAEATLAVTVTAGDVPRVQVVLQPAQLYESLTVTASRGDERLDTPASTTVVTSAELLNSAAGTVDDALRNTAGFSLFRRSSSRVANPTTQGVTLRGVSGSGASRTLVLADGLPLNDPFGNWVYWNRIPQAAIERVEVMRGAAGDLYGADALGGVIQILTFGPERPRVRAIVDGGSHDTARASLFGGGTFDGWTMTGGGEMLRTDGVFVVAEEDRGEVDVPANSDYQTIFGTVGYGADTWQAHFRAGAYGEDRSNGTPIQVNNTDWHQFAGEVKGTAGGGAWVGRVGGGTQSYYQTFSAVASDRASERIVRAQETPSTFTTASGEWIQPVGSHVIRIGGEGKRSESTLNETRFSFVGGVPSGPFLFGGTETGGSVFGQASLTASDRLTVVLGARGDYWRSVPREDTSPTHSLGFFSPRGSIAWALSPEVTLRASAYRASRTPTLNELHRGFRVGNVVTNPNPLLEPERLTGIEGGVLLAGAGASARITGFWNHLDDAIANITVEVTPDLTIRERQNAGKIRAAGVEVETDFRLSPTLTVTGLAVFTASHFRDAEKLPTLEGNRVPQVPQYQLGAGVTFADPQILTLSGQVRVIGSQFDDDLNQRELEAFGVVDVHAARDLRRGLHVFVAVENLFDVEYDVGQSGVRTIGWPRTARVGVRVFLP